MERNMPLRRLATLIATIITLLASQITHAIPGDILETIEINNIAANAGDINQAPITPHGITFFNGYMWVMDFGTDRIYRVYTTDTVDTFGNPVSAGDSDLNIPVSELTTPQLPGGGGNMPVCGAYPGDQFCGGGGLVHVNGFLWNASPVTDNILKIDPTDGAVQAAHLFTNHTFPSPSSLTFDGTHFWVIDWQSNTISKVLASTGEVLAEFDGPSNITDPRPTGITWDGLDLWLSYEEEERIYRIKPNTPPLLDVLDFFDAPGTIEGGARPKGLGWDGEFLWNADSGTGKIYKLETDILPFGITGCVQKNGIGVGGGVLLSQTASGDQIANTDSDGCFAFPQFVPGVAIAVELDEAGVSGKPFIQLNETTEGSTDAILTQNLAAYNETNFDFTATDPEDGNLHSSVTATPNVIDNPELIDITTINETGYVIEYNVIDSDGNDSEPVYRTIYVLPPDITPPDLTLNGSSSMLIEQNINNANLYVEPGASAIDDRDGDITEDIIILGTVDSSVAATYTINYSVSDAAGNNSTASRTIEVKDTTAPVITILGNNPLEIEKGDPYTEPGAQAVDNVEGTVSLNASNITGSADTSTVGSYTINYSYTDTGGNTATANRTVNIVDTGIPSITLRGSATVNHELNTPYTDAGASATDDTGEVISSDVPFTGSVTVTTIGTYTLTYNISDASGNAAPTITRQVIVDDTGAPSLSLNGNETVNLQKGDTYIEEGATATDAVDNNTTLTSSIVISGAVDTNTNGSYTVTYNVTDSAGNTAPPITRTITVSDTGIPVITLIGNQVINLQKGDAYNEEGATASDAVDDDTTLTSAIAISGTVNTNINGTYSINYNVSDSTGNAAITVTRTVIVADTGIPVITLIGNQTVNLQKGDPYIEAGATATDAVDDNATLTSAIAISGTVNTSINGTYTINYNVSDSTGNAAATVIRTITVSDTGIPVLTLNGNSTINLQKGDTYNELGATATDAVDNNATLTASISINGTVNSGTIGTYTRTYDVTDSSGNAAVQLTRTINVSDTGTPVITLIGNSSITLQKGDTYNEQGATATDAVDNDTTLTSSIVIAGTVNTNTLGTYTITYNVTDSAGNAAAQVTRSVIVSDTGIPVLTLTGNSTINLQKNDIYNEQGATATDSVDNDTTLTSSIVITGIVDTSTLGTYTVTYNVSDLAGNAAATLTRTIIVADTGIPVITLIGNPTINLQKDDTYIEQQATATDSVDDDTALTANIVIAGIVDTSTIGTYTVTYNVTDSGGNAAVQVFRTITVSDTGMPVISLTGNQTINLQTNDTYTEQGATATDAVDDDTTLTSNIVIAGAVDTSVNATYTVTYNVTDSAGNAAIQVTRTVIVDDTGSPVITLIGNQTINLQKGDTYTELGATATDAVDDDTTLTSNITLTGTVDTGNNGTYTRSYGVTDSSGNAAVPVTRTIIVLDTGIPLITLTGSDPINHEQGTPFNDPGATASDAVDGDMGTILAPESVDINTGGTYALTYNISDSTGNAASTVNRDVIVADTIKPVITLTGSATVNHEQGDTYTDAGATAFDSFDGSVGVSLDSPPVNTNIASTYIYEYEAADAAGNFADSVTRTIIVADTTAPVIVMLGDAVMDHTSGAPFVDPGYTATDNFDGNLFDDVITTFVNNGTEYLISYNVDDAGGNPAITQNRTVNVVTPTTITIDAEDATIGGSATVGTTELLFEGSGYIDLTTAVTGDFLEYDFTAFGVSYDLTLRFASNSSIPLDIVLNGDLLNSITLNTTGGTGIWSDTVAISITPTSGLNTLRINGLEPTAINIDTITLTPQ